MTEHRDSCPASPPLGGVCDCKPRCTAPLGTVCNDVACPVHQDWPHIPDAEAWLRYGWERGWCSPPVCVSHDGLPLTEAEDIGFDDHCTHAVRLYEDEAQRLAVEAEGGPVEWRASNRGWTR